MHRVIDDQILTVDQYLALPEDERFIDEVSRGRLVREPRPGFEHGEIVVRVAAVLMRYLEQHPIGKVVAESGFILATSPLIIRGPDVAFVRNERLREPHSVFFEGAPNLAIEVVSASNRPAALLSKIAEFLEAGTESVWVIYPRTRSIVIHNSNGDVSIHDSASVIEGQAILPGFELRVTELFAKDA